MITKKGKKRSDGKSSVKDLVNYVANKSKCIHRWTSNLAAEKCEDAYIEIDALQQMNAKGIEKNYHLIVSFRPDEKPSLEVMRDIEMELAEALGYQTHQRVAGIHTDTDQWHMHIAINKIDPNTFNNITTYRDYKKLYDRARQLEKKHGLALGFDDIQKNKAAQAVITSTNPSYVYGGLETFDIYVKEKYINTLKELTDKAETWHDIHRSFNEFGIEIKASGAGLVFKDMESDIHVKPSSISRSLSRGALEKRFGKFQSAETTPNTPKDKYTVKPAQKTNDTTALYQGYLNEQKSRQEMKQLEIEKIKHEKMEVEKAARERERSIKIMSLLLDKKTIRARKAKLYQEKKTLIKTINMRYSDLPKKETWQSYLIRQAMTGNESAIKALRSKPANRTTGRSANIINGENQIRETIMSNLDPKVRKNGDIIYQFDGLRSVTDTGQEIFVNNNEDKGILAALYIAKQNFGNDALAINGGDEFVAKVVELAASHNLDVTFKDERLESYRQGLIQKNIDKQLGEHHDSKKPGKSKPQHIVDSRDGR